MNLSFYKKKSLFPVHIQWTILCSTTPPKKTIFLDNTHTHIWYPNDKNLKMNDIETSSCISIFFFQNNSKIPTQITPQIQM